MISELLSTPGIAYLLLTVLGVEAIFLIYVWKNKRLGVPPRQVLTFLGAGAAFSMALGVVLADLDAIWLALCLCVAFVFHILDLKQRWQTEP